MARRLTVTEQIIKKTDELNKLLNKLPYIGNNELIINNINQAVDFLIRDTQPLIDYQEGLEKKSKERKKTLEKAEVVTGNGIETRD